MIRLRAPRRLLLILALAGVVLAPLGQAIAAPPVMAVTHEMASMAGDMPCCPDEPAVKMDCTTNCPFVALCIAGLGSIVLPESSPIKLGSLLSVAFSRGESFALSSLAGEPPSRPPKV